MCNLLGLAICTHSKEEPKLFTLAINRVLDDLIFGEEPHNIAVSVASIQSVNQERSPQPHVLPSVACDHMTYFISEAGLEALVEALYQ